MLQIGQANRKCEEKHVSWTRIAQGIRKFEEKVVHILDSDRAGTSQVCRTFFFRSGHESSRIGQGNRKCAENVFHVLDSNLAG